MNSDNELAETVIEKVINTLDDQYLRSMITNEVGQDNTDELIEIVSTLIKTSYITINRTNPRQ